MILLLSHNKFIISPVQKWCWIALVHSAGFPHSEIPGSKVATHLPGAYRRYAASFIAFRSHEASTMCPCNLPIVFFIEHQILALDLSRVQFSKCEIFQPSQKKQNRRVEKRRANTTLIFRLRAASHLF
jgi:hypothetical protein